MRTIILTLFIAAPLVGQNFDTSNNAALHGDYFVREVLLGGENNDGTISSSGDAIGAATFDGAGNYSFSGAMGSSFKGVYGLGANGLLYIQSFVDGTQYAYGGISGAGPSAFVASATEGSDADIIVAIPAGNSVSPAALKGNYSAGYVSFPNADVTQVREASLNFAADGAGNLSNAAVIGTALNLGGNPTNQTITGGSYTLSGEGSGMINLGSASSSQILSGSLNFYLSADGNIFIAGTPGGVDLIVGARSFSGTAGNANWNNVYFTGALEDQVSSGTHSLDASYGSWNANGQGASIAHQRFQALSPPQVVYDYTFDSQDTVQGNGTSSPADVPYQFTLADNGQVFIASGTQGLYSLMIGFAAPQFSGSGVFLNPIGVVNGASFAPITNPIAPDEIVTLFGSGLAASVQNTPGLPLPTSLGNVQVTVNGESAPLYYVSPTQITFLVPHDITPTNNVETATIQVNNNGVLSNTTTVFTNYTAPGLFAASGSGTGPAAAEVNNAPISASNPANVGSTVVFFATGLGTYTPGVGDGTAAPASPPAMTDDTDYVYVGGQTENIQFNGLTPGLADLFQVNATLVSGTPSGSDYSDVATPDAYTSEATIDVGGSSSLRALAKARVTTSGAKHSGRPGRAHRAGVAPPPRD